MGSITQWLTLFAYAVPELFGLGIALALLLTNARPGAARRLGLIGIGAMLAAALLSLGLGFYQQSVIASMGSDHASYQRIFSIISAIHVVSNLVSVGGVLAVVWGLCGATRSSDAGETTPGP